LFSQERCIHRWNDTALCCRNSELVCITSRHVTSHHVTSHNITSHHTTLRHITAHHIISDHITPRQITSRHITHHITTLCRFCCKICKKSHKTSLFIQSREQMTLFYSQVKWHSRTTRCYSMPACLCDNLPKILSDL
jgi:hypothetical protein